MELINMLTLLLLLINNCRWNIFKHVIKHHLKTFTFCFLSRAHLWSFSKSKFNLKSDRVNLVAPASPIDCLLYLPNVRAIYSTNWDQKGWPGSEIQMYYKGCPCFETHLELFSVVQWKRNFINVLLRIENFYFRN